MANKKNNNRKNNDKPRFSGQVKGAAKAAQSAKVNQTLSTPQVGQRPGQSATVYAPGVTPPSQPTPSRSTPEIKGLGQGIRLAGANGLSKSNYNTLAETTGKSDDKIIGKLDKINSRLAEKGKAGINLSSGAANMLIKKAQKSPPKYRGFGLNIPSSFGGGAIGGTLQSMLPRPGTADIWRQGQLTRGRDDEPGFNPGGHPDKNRMIGGTVIRANGEIANKGFGEQYKKPKKLRGDKEFGPYDGMEIKDPDLKGAGPLANPNTDTWLENQTGDGEETTTTTTDEETTAPVEEADRSASSGAYGLDLASWATGFRKARSARQKSGRDAQGLASQKKNPFNSWA
jgi:hypothetical protein